MRVVAVGDSYASGEGAMGAGGWVNTACHLSRLAAPADAANQLNAYRPTSFESYACSGANSTAVIAQLTGIPATGPVHGLTMSVGGNDIGFAGIITGCLSMPDCSNLDSSVTTALAALPARLAAVFAAVPGSVQNVFVTEYPDPTTGLEPFTGLAVPCGTPPAPSFQGLEAISPIEAAWASSRVVGRLNATIAAAVATANSAPGPHPSFRFVTGISARFATHGYCTGGGSPNPAAWLHPRYIATPVDSVTSQGDALGTLHPNDLGQREIAAQLVSAMRFLTVGNIRVPNVGGMDPATARATIVAAGLYPIKQTVPDTSCPDETLVTGQSPRAGAFLWAGEQVVYRVSVPDPRYC